jgi:hypothetical protein
MVATTARQRWLTNMIRQSEDFVVGWAMPTARVLSEFCISQRFAGLFNGKSRRVIPAAFGLF